MKSLRIIDQDFQQLGEITKYDSILITDRFHTIGEVQLIINRYSPNADLLQKGRMLRFDGQNDKVFVIKQREIQLDENGKGSENWSILALPLKAFLMQRITYPPAHTAYDNKSGPAETVMKHYIDRNFINPDKPERVFPNLAIAPNKKRGTSIEWQSRFKNVAEELTEISLASGLGFEIRIDIPNKLFVFDVVEGSNRTAGQSILPPVKFDPQFKTIATMSYSESEMNYRNQAIVAGPGEGINRIVEEVGTAQGRDRYEVFFDARDVSDEVESAEEGGESTPRPVGEIRAELANRGTVELTNLVQEEYLEAQLLSSSPLKYGRDYFLGDLVTVRNREWGVTLNTRITEIVEAHESNGYKVEATFGNNKPTLIDKIKQQFKQVSGEIRK